MPGPTPQNAPVSNLASPPLAPSSQSAGEQAFSGGGGCPCDGWRALCGYWRINAGRDSYIRLLGPPTFSRIGLNNANARPVRLRSAVVWGAWAAFCWMNVSFESSGVCCSEVRHERSLSVVCV
jgi:hypothetical protein